MPLSFLDNDRHRAAEFFVAFLRLSRLIHERIEAAADMQHGDAGFGRRGQVVERLHFRHGATEHGIFAVDARDLVGIRARPGIGFPRRASGAFQHGLLREAVAGQQGVNGIPTLERRPVCVIRYRPGHDVKPLFQECQIDNRFTAHVIGAEDPRFARRDRLRNNDVDRSFHPLHAEGIAVEARAEPRPSAGDVDSFVGEETVGVLSSVERRLGDPTAQVRGADCRRKAEPVAK